MRWNATLGGAQDRVGRRGLLLNQENVESTFPGAIQWGPLHNGLRFCCATKMPTASEAREPDVY